MLELTGKDAAILSHLVRRPQDFRQLSGGLSAKGIEFATALCRFVMTPSKASLEDKKVAAAVTKWAGLGSR